MFPASKHYHSKAPLLSRTAHHSKNAHKKPAKVPGETLHSGAFCGWKGHSLTLLRPPLLPGHQHWRRHGNGRVRPYKNTYYERKRKAPQHLAAKNIQRQHCQEGQSRGKNGPAQRLVDAAMTTSGRASRRFRRRFSRMRSKTTMVSFIE